MTITTRVRRTLVALMVACLIWPTASIAQAAIDESPNEWAMVADLLVARPIGLVFTVAGTAAWVVSLPFTLLAGHAGEAAGTLIGGPAETTFMRCLGCRNTGYTGKDIQRNEEKKAAEAQAEADARAEAEQAEEMVMETPAL